MTLRNTRSLMYGEMASGEQGDLILRVKYIQLFMYFAKCVTYFKIIFAVQLYL